MILKAGACAALALAAAAILSLPASQAQNSPRYEADVNWPKPLPERWVLGGLGGICVDARDHVLILNRQDVIEGDLNGDVWLASAPSGMVQKYTHDGSKLLLQIGVKGKLDSSDGTAKGKPLNTPAATFFMPSSILVDRTNGDVYVSDGEGSGTNRRIVVLDRTGKFLRHWVIDDMENVHCMTLANDGMVYVCNRMGSETGKKLGSFGRPGSFPGQFNQVHGIAVDSKGNVYLDENRGRRVHKFRPVAQ